ncbi:MAG: VWA domain-containing protein [Candidatus Sumerlaeota bacterium]|nr:VWA domain-containing protein [Candidatus Sumerlaeota bacterium]
MGIGFGNIAFLLGLLGVAAPIYVHLRQRQKAKKILFSTLRFLRLSDRHTARRHKIVDLLALLARCAVIALIALALSKPLIRPQGSNWGATSGPAFWAIVLDDSYSMGSRESGITPFDLAKEGVTRVLDLVAEGDAIAVLLTSGKTLPGMADVAHNKNQVLTALERLQPSAGASSVADGIERALAFIRDSTNQNHELIVITDLQRSNIEQVQKIDPLRLTEKVRMVHLLDVGQPGAANVTITALKAWRAGPYPGVPITFRATLRQSSSSPEGGAGKEAGSGSGSSSTTSGSATSENRAGGGAGGSGAGGSGAGGAGGGEEYECQLVVNGENIARKSVKLEGKGQVDVAFDHVLMEPGQYVATVSLSGDALDADNSRMVCCDVYEQVSILLLAEPASRLNPWDTAFFLGMALTPRKTQSILAKSPVKVDRKTPEQAASADFSKYNAVFCADVRSMAPETVKALQTYVRDGGRLIAFAGEWAATGTSKFYNEKTLFGWKFDGLKAIRGAEEEPFTMDLPDVKHPIFRALGEDPAINFQTVQFYRYVKVDPASLDSNSQALASLSNDAPFMLEKRYGKGSVLCFTAPPLPDWTSLPSRPLFLPFIHELVKYSLSGALADVRMEQVLQPFEVLLPRVNNQAPTQATLIDATKTRTAISFKKDAVKVEVPGLEKPGLYTIELRYGTSKLEKTRVLANMNPFEGDLTKTSNEQLEQWLPFSKRWERHTNPRGLATAIERRRKGISLTTALLAIALAAFMFESYLANMLLPRRQEEEQRVKSLAMSPAKLAETQRAGG